MASRAIAGDNGAAYLDRARADEFFARLKARTIEAMLIQHGGRVIDVGCGTGEEVAAMSRAAHDVSATGFDLSERNIAEANRRHVSPHVEFILADAHALPIEGASVDGCRSERTLQHVRSPATVVAEIARVLRSRGRAVLAEPDWPSCACAGGADRVAEAVLGHWMWGRNNNPAVGRHLPGLLTHAGIECVAVSSESVVYRTLAEAERAYPVARAVDQAIGDGIVIPEDGQTWLRELEDASEQGRFVFAVPIFTAVGVKP